MRQWHPAGVVRRDDGRALSGPYRYRRSICTIPDERIPDVQKRTRDTMKRKIGAAMLAGASTFAAAGADAEEQKRFTWEGTLEIGVDAVVKSDTPGADVSDTYLTLDVWGEFALAERVALFWALTAESQTAAVKDRAFEDIGLYVGELGVRFQLEAATVTLGKFHPNFGIAWDVGPGWYGTSIAEDYELSEQIGGSVDLDLGNDATLSFAVFYADDTKLSDSWGFHRGRNTVANGGAGNTGKLNNVALHFEKEFGSTKLTASARLLSASPTDVEDEKGFALGIVQGFDNGMELVGEVAHFTGFGGTTDDADYATLGVNYYVNDWTWSASYSQRDITSTGKDKMFSIGVDKVFKNGWDLGVGIARYDAAGLKDTLVGFSVVIPFGG